MDKNQLNNEYWFRLQYSVSEACGTLDVIIINKKKDVGSVRVATVDGEAKGNKPGEKPLDYESIDTVVKFRRDEDSKRIPIKIHDDEDWNPNRDFVVCLYQEGSNEELSG